MYFYTSIITTAPPLYALVIIISFLFASSSIAFCFPLDKLDFGFFIFLFFYLFRSFCTKSINVLMLWWVFLCVYFYLFFIWKGRFSWSVSDFGLISLKWARSFIWWKKFSASLYNCFLLYFFGVGTKLRFLFKSSKVSN